jgi:hypothetical protein
LLLADWAEPIGKLPGSCALKTNTQTVLFALVALLLVGLMVGFGERSAGRKNPSVNVDLEGSICTAAFPGTAVTGAAATPGDGWKSLPNWKKLAKDMSIGEVQSILGDPERMNGGTIGFWVYPNGGTVTFFIGKVDGWSEPK